MGLTIRRLHLPLLVALASLGGPAPANAGEAEPYSWRTDLTPEQRTALAARLAIPTDFSATDPDEALSAGAATSIDPPDRNAFSHLTGNLPAEDEMRFRLGRALFRKLWVSAPSSTQASDGLGPLFNARSCASCHVRDGRGAPLDGDGIVSQSFLLRLARPAVTAEERRALQDHLALNFPDPAYGTQLQEKAVPGLAGEGKVEITYTETSIALSGGEQATLRQPHYAIKNPAYGPLDAATTLSPRIAQPMIGLGLIEAIHPGDIRVQADPDDRNQDGISGKAAEVRDPGTGERVLGRFGWKAQASSVADQSANALAFDIGISSALVNRPFGDCQPAQKACLDRATGVQPRLGPFEAQPAVTDLITFYAQNIAVPARRRASFPDVLAGKRVFYQLGCPACHTPAYQTRQDAALPALANQLIWPYSDFLLHDMGDGLADGQPVGVATDREWRTPPLWGLGLTARVNGNAVYLHDGRARNLTEAILWHGGEGEKARDAFKATAAHDRQSLITFLESL